MIMDSITRYETVVRSTEGGQILASVLHHNCGSVHFSRAIGDLMATGEAYIEGVTTTRYPPAKR